MLTHSKSAGSDVTLAVCFLAFLILATPVALALIYSGWCDFWLEAILPPL